MSGRGDQEPADEEQSNGAAPEATPSDDQAAPRTPVTQQLGRALVIALVVIFGVFAADNAQHVDFSWLVGETTVVTAAGERVDGGVRLIVLLLGAFAIGAAVGGGMVASRSRAKRKAAGRS